jgi:hypothetical protein
LWFVQIDFFTITYSAEVPMSAAIGDRQLLGFMMWFVPNSGVTVPEIEALLSEPQRGPNDIFGYGTTQGWSASGSADQRALYACERGCFL